MIRFVLDLGYGKLPGLYEGSLAIERSVGMSAVWKWLWIGGIAAFVLLAIDPSAAEAGKRRRRRAVHVVHAAPVYVAPVYVAPAQHYAPVYAAPVQTYVTPVQASYHYYHVPRHVAPAVRVHVGHHGGVSVRVGRRGW